MSVLPIGIIGTGKYVPEKILTNADLERMVETNDEWIVSRTGIRERHIAAPDQATSDLAYEAAIQAIEKGWYNSSRSGSDRCSNNHAGYVVPFDSLHFAG